MEVSTASSDHLDGHRPAEHADPGDGPRASLCTARLSPLPPVDTSDVVPVVEETPVVRMLARLSGFTDTPAVVVVVSDRGWPTTQLESPLQWASFDVVKAPTPMPTAPTWARVPVCGPGLSGGAVWLLEATVIGSPATAAAMLRDSDCVRGVVVEEAVELLLASRALAKVSPTTDPHAGDVAARRGGPRCRRGCRLGAAGGRPETAEAQEKGEQGSKNTLGHRDSSTTKPRCQRHPDVPEPDTENIVNDLHGCPVGVDRIPQSLPS